MEQLTETELKSWKTKQEAAEEIRVSVKTIDRLVADGKIKSRRGRRNGAGLWMSLLDPADVERIKNERSPEEGELVTILPPVRDIVQTLSRHNGVKAESREFPPSELRHILYLTIDQARLYTGLSERMIQAAAREGKVARIGRKYRRQDLDKL